MPYRLILETTPGRVDTGATYPGCSRENPTACDGRQFSSVEEAVAFASANGEEPVVVSSAEEAWDIAEGRIQPPTSIFQNKFVLAGLALMAFKFLRR